MFAVRVVALLSTATSIDKYLDVFPFEDPLAKILMFFLPRIHSQKSRCFSFREFLLERQALDSYKPLGATRAPCLTLKGAVQYWFI